MKLSSPNFVNNGPIPAEFSCEGSDRNPELAIEGLPSGAMSLAITVEDPDSPGTIWQHWLVWNINVSTTKIEAGKVPAGAVEGRNDFGQTGYGGPCPHSGTHRYIFRCYALDTKLLLDAGAGRAQLDQAMEGHIIDQAELVGTFHHTD